MIIFVSLKSKNVVKFYILCAHISLVGHIIIIINTVIIKRFIAQIHLNFEIVHPTYVHNSGA